LAQDSENLNTLCVPTFPPSQPASFFCQMMALLATALGASFFAMVLCGRITQSDLTVDIGSALEEKEDAKLKMSNEHADAIIAPKWDDMKPEDKAAHTEAFVVLKDALEAASETRTGGLKLFGEDNDGVKLKMELTVAQGIWGSIDLAKDAERQSLWKLYAPGSRKMDGEDATGTISNVDWPHDKQRRYHIQPTWRHESGSHDRISKFCDNGCAVDIWTHSSGWLLADVVGSTFKALVYDQEKCVSYHKTHFPKLPVTLISSSIGDAAFDTLEECRAKCDTESKCQFYVFGKEDIKVGKDMRNLKFCNTYLSCEVHGPPGVGDVAVYRKADAASTQNTTMTIHFSDPQQPQDQPASG